MYYDVFIRLITFVPRNKVLIDDTRLGGIPYGTNRIHRSRPSLLEVREKIPDGNKSVH